MHVALIQNHGPGGEFLLQQPTPRICFLPPHHHSGDAKQDFRSSKKIWDWEGMSHVRMGMKIPDL